MTLLVEGEYPAGGKLNKQRVTVLFVTAMDGSLDQLVVVNNAMKPRAFCKIKQDTSRLPRCIQWTANKKAWVDAEILRFGSVDSILK